MKVNWRIKICITFLTHPLCHACIYSFLFQVLLIHKLVIYSWSAVKITSYILFLSWYVQCMDMHLRSKFVSKTYESWVNSESGGVGVGVEVVVRVFSGQISLAGCWIAVRSVNVTRCRWLKIYEWKHVLITMHILVLDIPHNYYFGLVMHPYLTYKQSIMMILTEVQ